MTNSNKDKTAIDFGIERLEFCQDRVPAEGRQVSANYVDSVGSGQ
jgi:hypothetical protein